MVVADALSRLHAKKATPFAGVRAVGLSMLQPREQRSQQPFVGATAPKVLRPPLPKGLDPDFVVEDGPISYFHGRLVGHFGVLATDQCVEPQLRTRRWVELGLLFCFKVV
jgi:hypothetical protein